MSMFRRPGDSSSSSETSDNQHENEEVDALRQDGTLSRIKTLDSAVSGGSPLRPNPPRIDLRQSSAQNVRDLLLHSLLEKEALTQAVEKFGKDRTDPDVQRLGREVYQEMARQVFHNVDDTYAGEEMRAHRATAQEGIGRLIRSNLNKLSATTGPSSQELVNHGQSILAMDIPSPLPELNILSAISIPSEPKLHGYPGLQTDRYLREFVELGMVGKGGYGKVFKAKHNLDGSFYAIKRIPISRAKMAKIQENGPQELESMLDEVRALARFDHVNVVRYHNAWLEFTAESISRQATDAFTNDMLLEDAAKPSTELQHTVKLASDFNSLAFEFSHETRNEESCLDIVFGISDTNISAEEICESEADGTSIKERLRQFRPRNRRASHATITTISSTKSHMSAVEDAEEEEEEGRDEEIEDIPRKHIPFSQNSSSDLSESMISHSDIPGHLIQTAQTPQSGPKLMLNVQMSLCEMNLAAFLSSQEHSAALPSRERHCFHPCVSMELLSNIVSGVQYLHTQDVVHRDLKPANIFLSLSGARHVPYGSVDLSSCKACPKRDCLHVTPRIGDFGLAAVLDNRYGEFRPVGTEFYRPQTCNRINDKLDVYALGVLGFEILHHFGTRMERIELLNELRCGRFPLDFMAGIGEVSDKMQDLICAMIELDESKRLSCDEVKKELEKLVACLKNPTPNSTY